MLDGQPLELFTCAPRMRNGLPSTSSDVLSPLRSICGRDAANRFAAVRSRRNAKLFMNLPYRHHFNETRQTRSGTGASVAYECAGVAGAQDGPALGT